MDKIRILLADDHAVLRSGLRVLINGQADMAVVAQAGDGEEAVRKAVATRPDVVLLDITMPRLSGIEAIERLRREVPSATVVVLTMHDDPAITRAALGAGAARLVVKAVDWAELLSAIRAAHRGGAVVELATPGGGRPRAAGRRSPTRAAGEVDRRLSRRERQVLELVALGHTNQEIAQRFAVSVKTIEGYRARVADKLGLRRRADFVRFALERGLLRAGRPASPGARRS